MDAQTFLDNFGTIAEAPGGIDRLRELILDLAVRGQLVSLQPDEDATSLLAELASEREEPQPRRRSSKRSEAGSSQGSEPPFILPAGWSWAAFRDVARIASNLVDPAQHPNEPHVAPNNIEKRRGRLLPYRTVEEDGVTSSKHRFHAGQILYSKIRPNLSKAVIVDFEGLCSADMYPIDARIEPRYLYLFILSETFIRQVTADDNRLAMPKVNQSQLSEVLVAVPPRTAQRRIVAKVDELMQLCDDLEVRQQTRQHVTTRLRASSLDALTNAEADDDLHTAWSRIHTNWEAITDHPDSVDTLRQTIVQLAVRGKLVEQRTSDGSAVDLLEQIGHERGRRDLRAGMEAVGKPYFRVPTTWAWTTFGFVTDARLGKMLDKANNTGQFRPYLRNTNVQWFRFKLDDVAELRLEDGEYDEYELRVGDLLICEGGEPGRAAVCDGTVAGLVFQKALHRARPLLGIEPWFLAFLLRGYASSGLLQSYFTGATIQHLTGRSLAVVPVPLPPVREQRRIVDRVWEMMRLCDDLETGLAFRASCHEELGRGVTSAVSSRSCPS